MRNIFKIICLTSLLWLLTPTTALAGRYDTPDNLYFTATKTDSSNGVTIPEGARWTPWVPAYNKPRYLTLDDYIVYEWYIRYVHVYMTDPTGTTVTTRYSSDAGCIIRKPIAGKWRVEYSNNNYAGVDLVINIVPNKAYVDMGESEPRRRTYKLSIGDAMSISASARISGNPVAAHILVKDGKLIRFFQGSNSNIDLPIVSDSYGTYQLYSLSVKGAQRLTMYDIGDIHMTGWESVVVPGNYTLLDEFQLAPEHTHNFSTFVSYATAPTCTSAGVGTYKCSCGQTTQKSVGALGHATPAGWSGSDATNHYKNCTRCGTRLQTVAHTWVANGSAAPSCSGTGYNDYKCNVCGKTRRDTVAALGHSWQAEYVSKAATCTDTGTNSHKCSRCGVIEQTSIIPALGHDYQWKWYTVDGVGEAYKQLTCTRCGNLTGDRVYNTYTVTYITRDIDNSTDLARETAVRTFGETARGSDIGTTNVVYNDIEYNYVSETFEVVHSDCTVYRNMRKHLYNLHFDANGGTGTMESLVWEFDKAYNIPANAFTRVGYTFQGWAKGATGNVLYANNENVANVMERTDAGDDVTLYAIWKANTYVVHFDASPATNPADKVVTFDSVYGTLPAVEQPGYVFKGWEFVDNDEDETHYPIGSTTVVYMPNDHTLTAIWEANAVEVTYISPSKSQIIECLVDFPTVAPFIPSEPGLVFKYWSISENGSEFDFNTPIKLNTTLYAVFEAKTIVIELPGAGEAERVYPAEFGDLPVPVQPGKDFEGWYYDEECTQPVNRTDKVPPEDITLHPKYSTSTYHLTLNGRSEDWEIHYQDLVPALPTLEQENKTFKYWSYEGKEVKAGDSYMWSKSIELTPIWEQRICNVVLPDGTTRQVESGNSIGSLPTAPVVSGKDFDGYVDQFNHPVTAGTIVTQDMIIKYSYRNKNVTLTLIDGDWNTKIAQEAGVTLTGLPTRNKAGYYFAGWSMYENGKATTSPVYKDTTLYAVFEADYQDIYLSDLNITVQKKTGSAIGSLPAAPKEGYEFIGWLNGSEKVTADTIVPGGGMTLHAEYLKIHIDTTDTVEVRYWSDGVKINTVDLPRGETLWDPGAPALNTIDSRKFMYWADHEGGVKYNFGARVHNDIDLYAQWN